MDAGFGWQGRGGESVRFWWASNEGLGDGTGLNLSTRLYSCGLASLVSDKVFHDKTGNEDVYQGIARDIVMSTLEGVNGEIPL